MQTAALLIRIDEKFHTNKASAAAAFFIFNAVDVVVIDAKLVL